MVKNNIKFIDNNFFDEGKKYMLREAKGFNLMDGISSGSNEPYQQILAVDVRRTSTAIYLPADLMNHGYLANILIFQ